MIFPFLLTQIQQQNEAWLPQMGHIYQSRYHIMFFSRSERESGHSSNQMILTRNGRKNSVYSTMASNRIGNQFTIVKYDYYINKKQRKIICQYE